MYYYFEHEHHKWKLYDVWFLRYGTQQNFSHFRPFFVLLHPLPLTTERIKILKKMKKTSGDIIILHKCTINDNHMIYGSWDMKCIIIFLSSWIIFCTFTITAWKMKIWKKWKKHLEISSFYTSAPKIMIICYNVPEIWHVMDVIVIFHFGLFFALLPP